MITGSRSLPLTLEFDAIQSNSRISTPLALFLEKLDAIPSSTIPNGFIRNTKLLTSLYAKKQLQIDAIVSEFANLYAVPIDFLALFEQRMLARRNTLTRSQTEHYTNILDFYLQFKVTNNENRGAARSLLTHLESHSADPDNSLIGLTPNKSILENLGNMNDKEKTKAEATPPSVVDRPFSSMFTTQDLIDMIVRWDEMSDDDAAVCVHQFAASARNHGQSGQQFNPNATPTSSPSSIARSGTFNPLLSPISPSASGNVIPKAVSSPALLRAASTSSLTNLVQLTPPGSPSRVNPGFSIFPGLFKKTVETKIVVEKSTWKEGDVVVVFVGMVLEQNNREHLLSAIKTARDEMNENAFMFARVSNPCVDLELNVGVYVDKDETKARVVSKDSVFKIKFEQATPSMVSDVSQKFFSKLSDKLAERTNLFLVSQGLDLRVLERTLGNESSLFDIPVLKRNIACVHSLQLIDSTAWVNFLDSVRTYSDSKVKGFVADIEVEGRIFPLSRKQVLLQLNNFDYTSIPTARMQSYLSASQAALDNLKKAEADILEGVTKQKLSEWYLDHIKDCVDSFLTRNGFELDVIPENYIDQAPKDLKRVSKNWDMTRELLDIINSYNAKKHNHHEVIDVMTTLMDDIYSKLDEFVRDSIFVISDNLGVTRGLFDMSENQDVYGELCKLFLSNKEQLDNELRDKLEELMKDVDYIFKIREMEGIQTNKSRDHVPISGLIASRFFRLENELRTSLDVWDPDRLERNAQGICADQSNLDSTKRELDFTAV